MNYCSFGHYCVDCADDTGYTDSQVVAYWQNIALRCARFASYLIQLSFTFDDLHDPQNLTTSLSWRWWCQFHLDVRRDYKTQFPPYNLQPDCPALALCGPFSLGCESRLIQSFPALSGGTTEPEWCQNCLCDSSPQRRVGSGRANLDPGDLEWITCFGLCVSSLWIDTPSRHLLTLRLLFLISQSAKSPVLCEPLFCFSFWGDGPLF